jgi:hypothetical protein
LSCLVRIFSTGERGIFSGIGGGKVVADAGGLRGDDGPEYAGGGVFSGSERLDDDDDVARWTRGRTIARVASEELLS